jgi:L-fuconolactonase
MWGTDWTRATELLTYEQGVEAFRNTNRLSDADKTKLMGRTLETVYGW